MSHPNYIGCDGDISYTANGLWVRCRISDGVGEYTEQQVSDFYSGFLSIDSVQALMPQVLICFAIAWGYRELTRMIALR